MLLKQLALRARGRRKTPTHKGGHDLAKDRGMVLRLGLTGRAFNCEPAEAFAQARQRPFVQKSSEIKRPVGQEFPASKANEKVEKLPLDPLGRGRRGSLRERNMREPERARITTQA